VTWDDEWVLILDDWLDGVTATPDQVLTDLSKGMGDMGGMGDMFMRMGNLLMGATSDLLGGDAGDVYYPHYLINGKPKADPAQFTGTPGARVRIRVINAGSDTAFRFAIGGHTLTITHTDGFPVDPVEVDSVLIGMGERYDLQVTLDDGVFPVVADAEGKQDRAFALVRTAAGTAPASDVPVAELGTGRVGTAAGLSATASVTLHQASPDRVVHLALTGGWRRTTGDQWAPVRHERPVAGRARGQYGSGCSCGSAMTPRCGIRSTCTATPTSTRTAAPGRTPPSSSRARP
jgi:FtsP/CotA-like multicopper oxidase with cupredoxin domain